MNQIIRSKCGKMPTIKAATLLVGALFFVGRISAKEFKIPADYFAGQLGGSDPEVVKALKADIPMAKRVLAECKGSKSTAERRSCAVFGQYIESPELADSLRGYLLDSDKNVRRMAAQSIFLIAPQKARTWLLPLADDPDALTRESALGFLHEAGRADVRAVLREKLNDPDPAVKLTVAMMLAADGDTIPREMALQHITPKIETESKTVRSKGKALRLLGVIGNQSDFTLLDEILSHPRDYNKLDARIARHSLRLKLAASADERFRIIDEAFRDERLRDWVAGEVVRQFRLGESSIRNLVSSIANDDKHPGQSHAKGSLELIAQYSHPKEIK